MQPGLDYDKIINQTTRFHGYTVTTEPTEASGSDPEFVVVATSETDPDVQYAAQARLRRTVVDLSPFTDADGERMDDPVADRLYRRVVKWIPTLST